MAFDELKKALISTPILAYPIRDGGKFILDSDCSAFAAGAVLSQIQNGEERVIGYASKTLSREQKNYCATYRELFAARWAMEYFRHYLWGRRFVLRTDHSSLRWLLNFKDPTGVVARWITYLSGFDYEVEHRSGKKQTNADGLSRCYRRRCDREECFDCCEFVSKSHFIVAPVLSSAQRSQVVSDMVHAACSNWVNNFSAELWRELQMEDVNIKTVITWIESGTGKPNSEELLMHSRTVRILVSQWKILSLRHGVLYRQLLQVTPGNDSIFQVVLPSSMRRELFHEFHVARSAGHLGRDKTYAKLRDRVYWPGMKQDVSDWVKFCKACTSAKTGHGKKRAKLVKMLCSEPLDRISLDFMGPLPESEFGNKYVMVLTDYFSKWVEAYPMKDLLAASAADILVTEFFCRFGTANIIHTDQSSQFEPTLFQEMCSLYEIRKTRTTPYHPRSDGLTERNNRTIQTMLRSYVDDTGSDWDVHLPYLLQAYRASVHDSTGFTPNKLFLGREISLPSDIVYGKPPNNIPYKCYTEFVEWFSTANEKAFEFARDKLRRSAVKQKRNFNNSVESLDFDIGSYCWYFYPPKQKKLSSGWIGPWKVIDRLENFTYRIQNVESGQYRISHVDHLHPYVIASYETFDSCVDNDDVLLDDEDLNCSEIESPQLMPKRSRNKPGYLNDFVTQF